MRLTGRPIAAPPQILREPDANHQATLTRYCVNCHSDRLKTGIGFDAANDMLSPANDGVLITVRVAPRAARSGIAGTRDGALLVRLNAAPVDGAANAELIEVLAAALGVPKRAVSISAGEKSRRKIVHVRGISVDQVGARIERAG